MFQVTKMFESIPAAS